MQQQIMDALLALGAQAPQQGGGSLMASSPAPSPTTLGAGGTGQSSSLGAASAPTPTANPSSGASPNFPIDLGAHPYLQSAFAHLFTPDQIKQYGHGPDLHYNMGQDGKVVTTSEDWGAPGFTPTPKTPTVGGGSPGGSRDTPPGGGGEWVQGLGWFRRGSSGFELYKDGKWQPWSPAGGG